MKYDKMRSENILRLFRIVGFYLYLYIPFFKWTNVYDKFRILIKPNSFIHKLKKEALMKLSFLKKLEKRSIIVCIILSIIAVNLGWFTQNDYLLLQALRIAFIACWLHIMITISIIRFSNF